jgi:predicted flap endonuclease-1-like 5' DNA nuclease
MLDDGVKAAGKDEDDIKVADLAIHVLDAIESGEAAAATPDAPLNVPMEQAPQGFAGFNVGMATAVADAPTETTAPLDAGEPANLKLTAGIGPMLEGVLNDAGITTFEQLAASTVQQLQDILPDLHDSRVEKEDWIGQAQRFASAKAEGHDLEEIARGNQET